MNNSIKVIIAAAAMTVAAAAFATNVGTYVGVNSGYGKVKASVQNSSKNNKDGFAYGIDGGYMFNQYVGVELGATRFANARFDHGMKQENNYLIDLAVKGVYPITQQFNVFGKLGGAYVHTKFDNNNRTGFSKSEIGTHHAIRPYLAAGVGYDITSNIAVDFQVATTTKAGNDVPAMMNAMIGATYTF